mmetsp:Transcript_22187/g.49601  ORF Transcript_22187/g.49601 Transcript_22187/m.49601 type:complete len:288 (+) Transcript_22187:1178-2041(+)
MSRKQKNWPRKRRQQRHNSRQPQKRRRPPRQLRRRPQLNKTRRKPRQELTKLKPEKPKRRPRPLMQRRKKTRLHSRRSRKTKPRLPLQLRKRMQRKNWRRRRQKQSRLLLLRHQPLPPHLLQLLSPLLRNLLQTVKQLLERNWEVKQEAEFFRRKKSTLLFLTCSRNTKRFMLVLGKGIPNNPNIMSMPCFPGETTNGIDMTMQPGHAVPKTNIDDHDNSNRTYQYKATLLHELHFFRNRKFLASLGIVAASRFLSTIERTSTNPLFSSFYVELHIFIKNCSNFYYS